MARADLELQCRVREVRLAAQVSQQALARAVGLSRQALSALEAGRAVPRTDVALRLARALHCQVETLFASDPVAPRVRARAVTGSRPRAAGRVLLADIDGQWVARPLTDRGPEPTAAADGVITAARPGRPLEVELLTEPRLAAERLVVMGCAPTLGLLSARLARGPRPVDLAWVHGSSGQALDALAHGDVHVAGIHLKDARSGRFNVPQVQRRFAGQKMLVVNFASWEQGLVVARGNPLHLRKVEDLLRPRIRLVTREAGSGAMKLLEEALSSLGAPGLRRPALVARGHLEVAQAVAQGVADAGIAIRAAALAWDLDFVPLSFERFDLVFPEALVGDRRVERLVDELGSTSFRRELDAVGGYETADSGKPSAG
jgi:putative molybdopterin biosynthesis protein